MVHPLFGRLASFATGGFLRSFGSRARFIGIWFFLGVLLWEAQKTGQSFFLLFAQRIFASEFDLKITTMAYLDMPTILNLFNVLGALFFFYFLLRILIKAVGHSPLSNESEKFRNAMLGLIFFGMIEIVYVAISEGSFYLPLSGAWFFITNIGNLALPKWGGKTVEQTTLEMIESGNTTIIENSTVGVNLNQTEMANATNPLTKGQSWVQGWWSKVKGLRVNVTVG